MFVFVFVIDVDTGFDHGVENMPLQKARFEEAHEVERMTHDKIHYDAPVTLSVVTVVGGEARMYWKLHLGSLIYRSVVPIR